ncbi:MAG TPA: phosphoribosylaminoimidazolesuccinocarboxamide synthase [Acidobacteriaceae bacterium]|jgi:phosphoribosylaminoimidazole-succinocarboxamide synthase|nr:phosphoribosylaminoimidazolesuccinocarboxamide synthase [Acidobacteriaceae bacterium]
MPPEHGILAAQRDNSLSLKALMHTEFDKLTPYSKGKVRDVYVAGDNLLMVATDRISAFDHILGTGIPGKGRILTQISLFWFDHLAPIVPNHVISASPLDYPEEAWPYREVLRERSMLVFRAEMFPVECVARGYLAGSGWKDYKATGSISGVTIRPGLWECDRLKEPIFTPATKSQHGEHDENITFDRMAEMVGGETAEKLRTLTLDLYRRAADHAELCGILLADTKFEFGVVNGKIVLADEALTPDSSRFWDREHYRPGKAQPSYDKQYVRDYLESIGWNKQAPAPHLTELVVKRTQEKYLEAFQKLTGRTLSLL